MDKPSKGAFPYPGEKSRALPKMDSSTITLADNAFLDAVFSGGYYVVFTDEDNFPETNRSSRAQQKRNARNEDALRLANLTRQMTQDITPSEQDVKADRDYERHERLLSEMHALIGKSGLVPNEHQEHLKDEISIAREQLLRDGSVDDYTLMRTLQEIADLQGLSMGGSAMAGKFASDILDPPEPVQQQEPPPPPPEHVHEAAAPHAPDIFTISASDVAKFVGTDIFEKDREDFLQRDFDQFCAYDISEVGGCKHRKSPFFAKKVKEALVETDSLKEPEQSSSELTP